MKEIHSFLKHVGIFILGILAFLFAWDCAVSFIEHQVRIMEICGKGDRVVECHTLEEWLGQLNFRTQDNLKAIHKLSVPTK